MQVWSRFKIERIEDMQLDTNYNKTSSRKVTLSSIKTGRSGNIEIEVSIRKPEDLMFSQLFDERIGEEVEVRFTAGTMLKEIDEREKQQ